MTIGTFKIRATSVYGRVTFYPVDANAKLIAAIEQTTTITPRAIALAVRLGFEVQFEEGSAAALNERLNSIELTKLVERVVS